MFDYKSRQPLMGDSYEAKPWPAHGLRTNKTCPVCQSRERELLHESLSDKVFFCAPGTWDLFRCNSCGSGYLDPCPSAGTIGLAYSQYFTHVQRCRPTLEQLSVMRRLRRALANGYRNARYGADLQPSHPLGVWVARLLPSQKSALDSAARHLPKLKRGATLLDVGCGNGEFLEMACSLGWKAEGVDFDSKAVETARRRGVSAYQGGIEDLPDRIGQYDAITMAHVIEHVHDPLALLKTCLRLLKPGGWLWLETPNLDSAGHAYYGRNWRGLEPPRHLVLFTWSSLTSALSQTGFIKIRALPIPPSARQTFPASEAIKEGLDPYRDAKRSLGVRWRARQADRKAARHRSYREFITVTARKTQ